MRGPYPGERRMRLPRPSDKWTCRGHRINGRKWAICSVRSEGRSVGYGRRPLDAFSPRPHGFGVLAATIGFGDCGRHSGALALML